MSDYDFPFSPFFHASEIIEIAKFFWKYSLPGQSPCPLPVISLFQLKLLVGSRQHITSSTGFKILTSSNLPSLILFRHTSF
jgi:hypothetical protein